MKKLEKNGYGWLNYPTMLPAAAIAVPATLDQYGLAFIPYNVRKKYENK